jgi:serine/threonine protein kinase
MMYHTRRKQRKQRKTRVRGGKLLGKGSYGCVYSPALRCKGNNTSPLNTVSKYMPRYDAIEERKSKFLLFSSLFSSEQQERLKHAFQSSNAEFQEALDELSTPEIQTQLSFIQEHFAFPTRMCEPNIQTEEERRENPFSDCDIPSSNTLLQLPDAGNDWDQYIYRKKPVTSKTVEAIIQSLIQLFDALEFLHDRDLVHMDIKPENITTKILPDGKGQSRLIDYGFLFSTKDLMSARTLLFTFGSNDYFVWPYEVRFLDPTFTEDDITTSSISTFKDAHINQRGKPLPKSIYTDKFGDFALTAKGLKGLYSDLAKISKQERANIVAKGCDVFALGRAIYTFFDTFISPKTNGYDIFLKVMEHMMAVDPRKRATIKEAKAEFQAWIDSL